MQGAVAGYIWARHDTQYRNVHFGKDPEYWKGRLRAGAFAWAYGDASRLVQQKPAAAQLPQASR